MRIILASASPRRKELLSKIGYDFEVIPSKKDEVLDLNLNVSENVKKLALSKAKEIFENNNDALVIGADTVVSFQGEIYGKPKDEADAYRMLKSLSNQSHEVISGVAILYRNLVYNFFVTSHVKFKDLSDEEIYKYIATKECMDKAGSYAIQGIGKELVSSFDGSYENIVGLPLAEVKEILDEIINGDN